MREFSLAQILVQDLGELRQNDALKITKQIADRGSKELRILSLQTGLRSTCL